MKIIPECLSLIIRESIAPRGTYLTFTYAGDYRQNTSYIPELLNYADDHGLVPDGPILELIWVDNHQSADIREHITELQIRVYPKS